MNRKHRLRALVWVDLFFVNISLLSNITVGVKHFILQFISKNRHRSFKISLFYRGHPHILLVQINYIFF